jgi:predicted phage tail component-like protein
VHIDSGMYQETFLSTRNIIEQETRYNSKPYFIEAKEQPRQIQVSFAFYDGFDEDKLHAVARALKKDYYSPLIFSENPDKIYYALCIDENNLIHTGTEQGYITLTFRLNSPYCFSPVYSSPLYDLSTNPAVGTNITLVNQGDIDMYFVATIQVISGGSFSIVNNTDGGKKMSFTGISNNEILTINTELEDITTDQIATYRYDKLSSDSVFMTIPYGANVLTVTGAVKIQFSYEFRFLV